jgi:NAD(P)-dependent dehydrogenase (short-subunit alcohol dehydrogenase family)
MKLKDKVAIVTGGWRGVGKAISLAFASEGARIVLAARSLSSLEEAAEMIKTKGGSAKPVQVDICEENQVQRMADETLHAYGKIDILVNNAGIAGSAANVVDMDLGEWKRVLATNLTGSMLCSREVLKRMIPRRSGNIINIGSEGGRSGNPMKSAYCVSKYGITGLTETLAIEVGDYNIRVNGISPAMVKGESIDNVLTNMAKSMGISPDEVMNRIRNNYALKRLVEPSEIAATAVFLASDASSGITGQTLVVSCGMHTLHSIWHRITR